MPQSIVCTPPREISDLSLIGTRNSDADFLDEPCSLTNADTYFLVDDEDPDDDEHPERKIGFGLRWSESNPFEFWTYFNRFVRFWPRKKFHVKYAYNKGFLEKKRRGTEQSQPLFDSYAVELTERHLDAESWANWKGYNQTNPIWLGLHLPKYTTVDAIDIDAKKYLLGYYRCGSADAFQLKPVVHLPLEHFKMLKRIYDAFPGRIWCISSETLGIHAWKKHPHPLSALKLHYSNKELLAQIGLGHIEAHPMPGRCFRRPFGADYRTITPNGVLGFWTIQLDYFENDGRTPDFPTICRELLKAMLKQWSNWTNYRHDKKVNPKAEIAKHRHEVQEVTDWIAAGCPLESNKSLVSVAGIVPTQDLIQPQSDSPQVEVTPLLALSQGILAVTLGEQPKESLEPLRKNFAESAGTPPAEQPASSKRQKRSGNNRGDLSSLRGGNWAKELLRLACGGLDQEDSVATVVHEMAKWLWWIELHDLPESIRRGRITSLLTAFVLKKHNGFVTRLQTGQKKDVINQIARCVELAAKVVDPQAFESTRWKWLNGGYRFPIRLVPALQDSIPTASSSLRSDKIDNPCGVADQVTAPLRESVPESGNKKDVSVSSSCLFTSMCTSLDEPLPAQLQSRILLQSGRNKIIPFATRLLNRLYNNRGKEYLGRPTLLSLLETKSPRQLGKYLGILEKAGVIRRGSSYSSGRNGKLITLDATVMSEMAATRDISANQA